MLLEATMSSTTLLLLISLLRKVWGRQVHAVVVAQVVVADDSGGLDARTHQEVHQHALHLGLPRLEVVPADHHLLLDGQLQQARHKGVLGSAVDKRHTCML